MKLLSKCPKKQEQPYDASRHKTDPIKEAESNSQTKGADVWKLRDNDGIHWETTGKPQPPLLYFLTQVFLQHKPTCSCVSPSTC